MRELRTKKKWVEDYEEAESLTSDIEILLDFFKEGEATADEMKAVIGHRCYCVCTRCGAITKNTR